MSLPDHMLAGCDADMVVVGHTHWPLERRIGAMHVVNDGSISNPWSKDLRASYVFLDANEHGYAVEFRRVDYDCVAAIDAARRAHHPSGAFIIDWLSGGREPWWDTQAGGHTAGWPGARE